LQKVKFIPTPLTRHVTLNRWAELSWRDGVQVEALAPLDTLVVRTRNSCYEMTVVSPAHGDVLLRGGRLFPEFTRVRVSGSSLGGCCLKVRGIYVGFRLEVACGRQVVVTTRVLAVERPTVAGAH
jgi:hypothetical protein